MQSKVRKSICYNCGHNADVCLIKWFVDVQKTTTWQEICLRCIYNITRMGEVEIEKIKNSPYGNERQHNLGNSHAEEKIAGIEKIIEYLETCKLNFYSNRGY